MKRTTSDLLDEYRHGDLTKRLHLYLQYRELRPEFAETHQNEPGPIAPRKMPAFRWLPKFLTCTFGKACSFSGKA
ncbi:MAG: hypothetical protein KJ573_04900 [Proteobacteria bacterium]|nr:hypothetical protein [Pseudomonadota bacterium]MBU1902913.1 hypothetical protein [Pseudomonadota bacterium]